MTAEVGVLNKLGVGLAADSAVTLGPSGKTYASADKLFQLSRVAPVGIMVYGQADFLSVPWETIVKLYREQLGTLRLPRVRDYATHLVSWLNGNRRLFPANAQGQFIKLQGELFYSFLRGKFLDRLSIELQSASLDENDIRALFDRLVETELARRRTSELVDNLPEGFFSLLRRRYSDVLARTKTEIFENLPISQGTSQKLTSLIVELLLRRHDGPLRSGVVIAGFGEEEHFPALVALWIQGMAANRALTSTTADVRLGTDGTEAIVIPFAQREMVATFMNGIDPMLRDMMEESSRALASGIADTFTAETRRRAPDLADSLEKTVKKQTRKAVEKLLKGWAELISQQYNAPVMTSIAALPKDELASIAEALVNLTKFKRRVSQEPETVGGPIDVAVITKGDGFVWVRRKHYFRPELNPRFIAHHYREEHQ